MDNTFSENALRAVAIGRKNWMFAGSDMAAWRYAVLLSLLTTAIAAGVEPERWLAETLMALPTTPQSQLDTLLPLRRPVVEVESVVPPALAATG